jgi:glycosyltransferase involved in cell wall biosynthesis
MKKENPRISVIIICYNQEEIISRAINSVICQKDYLYELIISDDCSTDGTWNVIRGYLNKYPDKIKAYRQEHNLGVYENLHSTYDKVTGDIVFFLNFVDMPIPA